MKLLRTMKRHVNEVSGRSLTYIDARHHERCSCMPPSAFQPLPTQGQAEESPDDTQAMLMSRELSGHLHNILSASFPRSTPFSLLLLHVSQHEHILSAPESARPFQYLRLHPPRTFLDQVLVNVCRVIRASDPLLVHAGIGALVIFPDVDQQGMYGIAERVYQSINLLQAETVIPPLRRITDILLGSASYPEPAGSPEELLYYCGLVVRKLMLQPAISRQLRSAKTAPAPAGRELVPPANELVQESSNPEPSQDSHSKPFMRLPVQLSRSMKRLIPHDLALELHCAPVGRDHNRLTVAMADPTNTKALKRLREITGLSIFAVSCEEEALNTLLANKW